MGAGVRSGVVVAADRLADRRGDTRRRADRQRVAAAARRLTGWSGWAVRLASQVVVGDVIEVEQAATGDEPGWSSVVVVTGVREVGRGWLVFEDGRQEGGYRYRSDERIRVYVGEGEGR